MFTNFLLKLFSGMLRKQCKYHGVFSVSPILCWKLFQPLKKLNTIFFSFTNFMLKVVSAMLGKQCKYHGFGLPLLFLSNLEVQRAPKACLLKRCFSARAAPPKNPRRQQQQQQQSCARQHRRFCEAQRHPPPGCFFGIEKMDLLIF